MASVLPSYSAGEVIGTAALKFQERSKMHGNVFLGVGAMSKENGNESGTPICVSGPRNSAVVAVLVGSCRAAGKQDDLSNLTPRKEAAGAPAMSAKARVKKKKVKAQCNKVSVLCDDAELQAVNDAAERKGQSVSTYVRSIIREKHCLGDFGTVAIAG
ncbi:MAG: hypothetical protein QM754_18255 [Tepidisphaeraceae bacterium]